MAEKSRKNLYSKGDNLDLLDGETNADRLRRLNSLRQKRDQDWLKKKEENLAAKKKKSEGSRRGGKSARAKYGYR